jgi:hypothetical protein
MQPMRRHPFIATVLSVLLHALALWLVSEQVWRPQPPPAAPSETIVFLEAAPTPPPPLPDVLTPEQLLAPAPVPELTTATPEQALDAMAAPPPPTGEEWALAARYTLKNSKRYRYTWGQQVRSLMGTAVEGPEQGIVRFRIEIAPDGRLASVQTLWATSAAVEQRARLAISQLPALPPTPTGQPLIFEKTVSFQAFESGGPPLYKDDCLPDPPAFGNPFAWDGRSPPAGQAAAAPPLAPDPRELEECLKQLQADSIEAESANDRRQLEQWGSSRLKR